MLNEDIIRAIESAAPPDTAEAWDNVGLQVGDPQAETNGCLLALDVTAETIPEARRAGVSLIVAHHPLIFAPLAAVSAEDAIGATILAAARSGVSIYAAHTNLDASPTIGTAAALADRLGIERGPALIAGRAPWGPASAVLSLVGERAELDPFFGTLSDSPGQWHEWPVVAEAGGGESVVRREMSLPPGRAQALAAAAREGGLWAAVSVAEQPAAPYGLGMVSPVPEISLGALTEYVSVKLGHSRLAVVGDGTTIIRRVALAPGSGGSMVEAAAAVADVLLTGEIKYHEAQRASQLGLAVLAAGHYDTERPVLDLLARYLTDTLGRRLTLAVSQIKTDPFGDHPE